jgi:hypothetical protein
VMKIAIRFNAKWSAPKTAEERTTFGPIDQVSDTGHNFDQRPRTGMPTVGVPEEYDSAMIHWGALNTRG